MGEIAQWEEVEKMDALGEFGVHQKEIYDGVNRVMAQGRTPAERAELLRMVNDELKAVIEKMKGAGI